MDDKVIFQRIDELVAAQHDARMKRLHGEIDADAEAERLRRSEVALDQCWDLLRRRRALKEAGQDPDEAKPLDPNVVEGYLQ